MIIAERVKALLPGVVVLENTPRHDHAANPAERTIRSVEDQVRVLRLDVEARYGISLNANMSLWPWIARHAGWLLTRCKIKGNGCTPYQDAYGTKYSGEMLNIAETVLFRLPYPDHRRISGKKTLHKGDSVWERGIWCGRSEDIGEHILLTTDGRVRARTVRRLPAGSGADITLLRESIETPWDPMLGTVTENNIPMPAPEVCHREVEPLVQEAETPIVETHSEDPTVEQKQKHEDERTKNFPAEASASSTGSSTSGHAADVPMTAVFETSLRDLDTRRSCGGKRGRLCCEQGADRENPFFLLLHWKCQAGTLLLLIFMLCGIR